MGQCPIAVPGSDEEDLSIATAPSGFLERSEWSSSSSRGSFKSTFLKLHKPDRSQKCILDPHQVYRALHFQTHELLVRDGLKDKHQYAVANNEQVCQEGTESVAGHYSEAAKSVMTTWSTATQPVANVEKSTRKRGQSKKYFSVLENIEDSGGGPFVTTVESDDDDDRGMNPEDAIVNIESINQCGTPEKREKMHVSPQEDMVHRYPANCLFLSDYFQPKPELELRTEKYMSVLHLRMRAKLVDYYRNHFLPVFPKNRIAPQLSTHMKPKSDDMPHLASDSSSSTQEDSENIDFGLIPPSSSVKFLVSEYVFMDLSLTGSLGMDPRSQSRRIPVTEGRKKSPAHYVVLMNRRSGIPLAVCALKASTGPPIVRIYATQQRVFGQRPAASTKRLGLDWAENLPLFPWAEIASNGELPQPVHFSIYMASGSDGRFTSTPSYRAVFMADGSPDIRVIGRTDKERYDTGCALISVKANEDGSDAHFRLSIAQGIDPALLICFTAVFDEIIEKFMREECRKYQRHALTK